MTLFDQINDDIKSAVKNQNKLTLSVLRTLKGELQTMSDGNPASLSEEKVIAHIRKTIKNIDDTLKLDIAEEKKSILQQECDILDSYVPSMLDEAEIREKVNATIASTGATSPKQMGQVMGGLKQYASVMDMKIASTIVKEILNSGN